MSVLTKNDCGVTTILPLGIDCSVVNATTPLTYDGRIYLNITGGSAPYSISWSNGFKTQTIKNLQVGTYTGTVVDYYGDYSATTVCTVDSTAIYVDYFQNCYSGDYLYLTGLTQTFEKSKVYRLNENQGCYIYSGQTIVSGKTLTTDTLSSGPYDTCEECDPPPPPLPYYPETLCLYTDENTFTAYPFVFTNFVNNKPAYSGTSSSSSGFTISWYTANTYSYWVVGGYTQLKNTSDTFNPLGVWTLDGTQQNWSAVSGSCPSAQALSFTTTTNNETCQGLCDGSVVVSAKGGTGGYMYSLDGVNYTAVAMFKKLCPQTNTAIYVKDSSGTIVVGSFTINPGPKRAQYTLSLQTKQVYTTQNWGTQTVKKLEYVVNVSPPLPDGVTINLPLIISVDASMIEPGSATTVYTPTLYSGGTAISPTSNTLISTVVTKSNVYSYRYPYSTIQKKYSVSYPNITIKKGLTVSGTVISTITKVSDGLSSCCQPFRIENAGTNTQYYTWKNCTGGTENSSTTGSGGNFAVYAGQVVNLCACSVTPLTFGSPTSLIISQNGTLPCNTAVVDAYISLSVGFNGPSISNGCSTLQVLTPPNNQSYSQLYQPYYNQQQ